MAAARSGCLPRMSAAAKTTLPRFDQLKLVQGRLASAQPGACRTAASIRSATNRGSSCSQYRRTVHPAASILRSCRRSRCTLARILALHQSPFRLGIVRCSGQECQKHPSRNTATRARGNWRSGRAFPASGIVRSTLNRRPRAWTARRTAISNGVSRRGVFRIRRRVAGSGTDRLAPELPPPIVRSIVAQGAVAHSGTRRIAHPRADTCDTQPKATPACYW